MKLIGVVNQTLYYIMNNKPPNYPYLSGFLESSMTAENLMLRMKHHHGYNTSSESEREKLRVALEQVCEAILKEAYESSIANA